MLLHQQCSAQHARCKSCQQAAFAHRSYVFLLHCRFGFIDNLTLGGPAPLGARAANLTEMTRPFMEEIALNEQGHALFTRQAGSTIPCPLVDFDGGFNDFMAAAYGLPAGVTVEQQYGSAYGKLLTLHPTLQASQLGTRNAHAVLIDCVQCHDISSLCRLCLCILHTQRCPLH